MQYLPANLERDRVKDRIQRGHHIGQQRRRTGRTDQREGRHERRRATLERVLVEKIENRVVDQRNARLWSEGRQYPDANTTWSEKRAVHETRVEQNTSLPQCSDLKTKRPIS